ncbi:MAG: hypothetical protein IJX76_07445 [Clostridia bacterium]|nr:hypothetical protein [Clostridia bacterium]
MSTDKHMTVPAAEIPLSAAGDFHHAKGSDPCLLESPTHRFATAVSRVEADRLREGIGTLGEKTLHAVLKHFYQPDPAFHEQKIGSYFADIAKDGEIIEIQTRGLYRLKKKITAFLQKGYAVTVVHPVPRTRWIYWIDGEGNLSNRRKSPKTGHPFAAAPELASLDELVGTPGLTFVVLLLDVEDFRNLDGWGKDGKRGSTRFERMPVTYVEEIRLYEPEDWRRVFPDGLSSPFTAAQFYKKGGYPSRGGYYALKLFEKLGLVRRAGTKGKAFLYEVCEPTDQ